VRMPVPVALPALPLTGLPGMASVGHKTPD
jgi:hypothetical protein